VFSRRQPCGTSLSQMGAYLIPAFQAEATIRSVVLGLSPSPSTPVLVIDDGSTDGTAEQARAAGAIVLSHPQNRGKGAALLTGLEWAREAGHRAVVSLDADGQHPPSEAARLLEHPSSEEALVLGVRNLERAGAPAANRRSNAFSNLVLSWFGGRRLEDTQCGLRRYPVAEALALGARARGFAFEAEVVLRAARTGMPIVHVPCEVLYPHDRTTHFDSVRDPTRIVARVVWTWLTVPHHRRSRRFFERALSLALLVFALLVSAHWLIDRVARFTPPHVAFTRPERNPGRGLRRVGRAQAVWRQGMTEVLLVGSPAEIGWAHGRLLRGEMEQTEGELLQSFQRYVPTEAARLLLLDLARFRYRNVDRGMSPHRLQELVAEAEAFDPDPFASFLPTYQRFVYLNALYDISLSLEHSPLLGCTTFTVAAGGDEGHPFLARAFDFEVDDVFDRQKAVFFVAEDGQLPFASVSWPGLVGVVTGLNAAGVGVVVHGARGGEFATEGEPVVHAVRRVLGQATTTEEAFRLFNERPSMVSHLVVVQDYHGRAARFERAPGRSATWIELGSVAAVSNHFEGPLAGDPKNLRVMRETSTVARRARGDALIREHVGPLGATELARFLKDKMDPSGRPLAAGDRRAIDADIATHAVIMDTRTRTLWVNQGPHLRGEFVRFDLGDVFERLQLPEPEVLRETLPP